VLSFLLLWKYVQAMANQAVTVVFAPRGGVFVTVPVRCLPKIRQRRTRQNERRKVRERRKAGGIRQERRLCREGSVPTEKCARNNERRQQHERWYGGAVVTVYRQQTDCGERGKAQREPQVQAVKNN